MGLLGMQKKEEKNSSALRSAAAGESHVPLSLRSIYSAACRRAAMLIFPQDGVFPRCSHRRGFSSPFSPVLSSRLLAQLLSCTRGDLAFAAALSTLSFCGPPCPVPRQAHKALFSLLGRMIKKYRSSCRRSKLTLSTQ